MPDCQKIEEILGMVVSLVIQRFVKKKNHYEHNMKDEIKAGDFVQTKKMVLMK